MKCRAYRGALPAFDLRERIAEADREIAEPPLVTDAVYRAAGEPLVEFGLAPREELDEPRRVEAVTYAEVRFGAALREPVPRTRKLTIIATVHAIADERP